jgi:HK97 family phage major capsid protein
MGSRRPFALTDDLVVGWNLDVHRGGFLPQFLADGQPSTGPDPSFSQDKPSLLPLRGDFAVSEQLVRSSAVNFDNVLAKIIGPSVAHVEDYNFLRGDGIGKPAGILGCKALVKTAARAASGTILASDIRKVWASVPPACYTRLVWACSKSAEGALLDATGDANGLFGNTSALLRPEPGAAYGLLHRPVCVTSLLPALNTAGDFMALDPSYYLILDGATELDVSADYDFQHRVFNFRFIRYVTGLSWPDGSLTLGDGSAASPFVALGTA